MKSQDNTETGGVKPDKNFGQAIRWSTAAAGREFPIDERVLVQRLRRAGEVAGPDGRWSTAQVCGAVYGDYDNERTRLVKAQADQAELELAESRKLVVQVESAFLTASNMLFAVRREIELSELANAVKDRIFGHLQGLSVKDFVSTEAGAEVED